MEMHLTEKMKLVCECLNVNIHVRGAELPLVDNTTLDLNELCLEEEFFNLKLSEAALDLEGVQTEHKYLVTHQTVCDWVISRCENCSMLTHACKVSTSNGKVLVNTNLLQSGSSTERLQKSSDFSRLFRIVLRGRRDDNHPIRSQGLAGSQFESLQSTLTDIQQKLNHYLIEEENAMEERIRQFEEKQRANYAELQSKARQEKNDLISLVLSTANSNSFYSQRSPPRSPTGRPRDNSTSSVNGNRRLASGDSTTNKKTKSTTVVKPQEVVVDAGFDDPLFGVDGFDDISDPFYESDDEEEEDDSLSEDLLSSNESGIYSTSVPISVPLWKAPQRRKSHRDEEEEERKKTPPLENMAASMQALARSVHGDSTEIFGDRPRPRLNTMDMAKIRR